MNEHTKTCCSGSPCIYRVLGAGTIGYCCDYGAYCDFQLPRDSRMQPQLPPMFIDKNLGAEQICPYCHLPLSQCREHTICGGADK